ncbi:MAG: CHAT domain-containing protein [Caldilinea sp. CFX5]|nr:CHAT domain-containing protein [Caldilinea sp. CFX5]
MFVRDYRNFDLLIETATQGYRAYVLNAPGGEGETIFSAPFSLEELGQLAERASLPQRSQQTRPVNQAMSLNPQVVGERLFTAAFREKVADILRDSLARTDKEGQGLRIRLRLHNAGDLAELPWEYLFDPTRHEFLALSERTPVVRYLEIARGTRRSEAFQIAGPLRILVVLAEPIDVVQLNVKQEWQKLQATLERLQQRGLVVLEQLLQPTRAALQHRLAQPTDPIHVLHFIGHGMWLSDQHIGCLVFENELGNADLVTADILANLIRDHDALRLIFLNACEGARSSKADPFAGVAPALVSAEVPAVIAMQFAVTDDAATRLAAAFYTALADGLSVDAALAYARKEIYARQAPASGPIDLEWGTPVLFMRAEKGELFDLRDLKPTPPCPYPGMVPFGETDKKRFFGREAEIREAMEALRLHRFLAVIGPSGCGKSSLVFAGILPALQTSHYFADGEWIVKKMRPGEQPLRNLTDLMGLTFDELRQFCIHPPTLAPGQRLLLIVDQFEEVFTQNDVSARENFEQALQHLLNLHNLYVILTIRADFYADLFVLSLWRQIKDHRLEVGPLKGDSLRQAIERPAKDVWVDLAPTLVERLLADAGDEPGVLPFIQETLVMLWGHVRRLALDLDAYTDLVGDKSGRTGLQVAIAQRAEDVYKKLPDAGQTLAQRIFLRLVQFGEGRADTRRQQTVDRLRTSADDPQLFDATLETLTQYRLVTVSNERRYVDIAHEALIAGWPRLHDWIKQRRTAEQTRRRLEEQATEWVRLHGQGGLLDAYELHEAESWLASTDGKELGASKDLHVLVDASRTALEQMNSERDAARQRELDQAYKLAEQQGKLADEQRLRAEEQVTANVRLNRRAWIAIGAGIVALLFAIVASWFGIAANRRAAIALARQLSSQAIDLSETLQDPELGLLLALEAINAMRNARKTLPEVDDALRRALAEAPITTLRYKVASSNPRIVFSPDGSRLASISAIGGSEKGGTFRLVDTADGRQQAMLQHREEMTSLAFSVDGSDLAIAISNTVHILDGNSGQERTVLQHDAPIAWVSFTPQLNEPSLVAVSDQGVTYLWHSFDQKTAVVLPGSFSGFNNTGTRLTTVQNTNVYSSAHVLYIWDVATGTKIADHEYPPIRRHRFSPDGSRLVVMTLFDKLAHLLDSANGQELNVLPYEEGLYFDGASFTIDGSRLATVVSNTVHLVDSNTGHPVIEYQRKGRVLDLAFSPAFKDPRFAIASDDGAVEVSDSNNGELLMTLPHDHSVYHVIFSPDGSLLATASNDNTVRIWNSRSGELIVILPHDEHIYNIMFNTDGSNVVTASGDGGPFFVHFWRIADDTQGQVRRELGVAPGNGGIFNMRLNPDRSRLAFVDLTATAYLYDVPTGELMKILRQSTDIQESKIYDIQFSPDGSRLATSSTDGVVRLWRSSGAVEPVALELKEDVINIISSAAGYRLFTKSNDGTLRLRDPIIGKELYTFAPMKGLDIIFSNIDSSRLVALDSYWPDGTLRDYHLAFLLDSQTRKKLNFHKVKEGVLNVIFSPDNTRLVLVDRIDSSVALWDSDTGDEVASRGELSTNIHVAFSSDSKFLATSAGFTVRIWDSTTGDQLATYSHQGGVSDVTFNPDGSWLAVATEAGTVYLWDRSSGKVLDVFQHAIPVHSVVFSPDGSYLATMAEDFTVHIWNTNNRQEIAILHHPMAVYSVVFAPDSSYLATYGQDHRIRLWNSTSGEQFGITPPTGLVRNSIMFNADGSHLMTVSSNGTIRQWRMRIDELVEIACQSLSRNLTQEEWNTYLGESTPYHRTCSQLPVHLTVVQTLLRHSLSTADNIKVALDRFRNALELNQLDAKVAVATKELAAKALSEESYVVAQEGKLDDALILIEEASIFSPNLDKEYEQALVKNRVANRLLDKGVEEAQNNNVEDARKLLQQAKQLGASFDALKSTAMTLQYKAGELASVGNITDVIAIVSLALDLTQNEVLDRTESLASSPEAEVKAKKLVADKLVEQGRLLARQGKTEEAVALFRQALALDSDLLSELDPIVEAKKEKESAVSSLLMDGDNFTDQGMPERAIARYTKAIALDPVNADAYLDRGLVYYSQKAASKAIADFSKFIELNGKPLDWIYFLRGDVFARQGIYDKAMADFNKAIEMNPKKAIFYSGACEAGRLLGHSADVLDYCQKAVTLAPNKPEPGATVVSPAP